MIDPALETNLTEKQEEKIKEKFKLNSSGYESEKKMLVAACSAGPGMDGAVAVEWCGMVLCIERDGYCHT